MAQLQTPVREKPPVGVVVVDDEEIGFILARQEIKAIVRFGSGYGGLDRAGLATGCGVDGVVVESGRGPGDTLRAAAASGRTTLTAVRIGGGARVDRFNALQEP